MQLPVTTFFAASLGLLLLLLSYLIVRVRQSAGVSLGHGDHGLLERRIRAQGNFIEYVPLALILLLLLELQSPPSWLLCGLGGVLLLGRCLHGYGLAGTEQRMFGRFWGTLLTWLMLLASALLNLWFLAT